MLLLERVEACQHNPPNPTNPTNQQKTSKLTIYTQNDKNKMPKPKTLICKTCNSSFVPVTTIQKATSTCGECIKAQTEEEEE